MATKPSGGSSLGIDNRDELIRLRKPPWNTRFWWPLQTKLLSKSCPSYSFEGLLVEGIVDLLFQEKEGLVIVDYKTDAGSEAELERRWADYSRQGSVYAAAMADITGRPVKEVSFIFVRKGLVKSFFNPDPAHLRQTLRKNINRKA